MSIVVITMPGSDKRAFVNKLHRETDNGVSLVLVQNYRKKKSRVKRILKLLKQPLSLLKEVWYSLRLRLSFDLQKLLSHFRATHREIEDYVPPVVFVDDINAPEVEELLKKHNPEVLAVWGSRVLKPHIIDTAKQVVNLHLGKCPHYRGTLANQCAVLHGDFNKIGATIHHVNSQVDSGNVISVTEANSALPLNELFSDLYSRAQDEYISVISQLHKGVELTGDPQDLTQGKNLLLKDWKPSVRYKVARALHKWDRERRAKLVCA